jgi:hypothetical protein
VGAEVAAVTEVDFKEENISECLETKMGLIFECFKGRKTSDLLFFLRRQGM